MAVCELCGEPLPPGEEMFNYHGFSGPCPKPPMKKEPQPDMLAEAVELLREFDQSPEYTRELFVKTDDFLRRYDAAQKERNDA